VEKTSKMGKKTTKQVGRVKQACHLEQTPQTCIGMARWYNIPESKIEEHQRGVSRQEQGMVREELRIDGLEVIVNSRCKYSY